MSQLSLTSKIQHLACCFFIGTPESMGMDPDFSIERGDRWHWLPTKAQMGTHDVQCERLGVDCFRRGLHYRVGVLAVIATMVVVIPGYALVGGVQAAKQAYQEHKAVSAAPIHAPAIPQTYHY